MIETVLEAAIVHSGWHGLNGLVKTVTFGSFGAEREFNIVGDHWQHIKRGPSPLRK